MKLLTDLQLERYSRQILLPEIGIEGQLKLLGAKVAIVGAGGLGAPASIYLAAAGIGTIGLIDADCVDRSNLHRQILHFENDVGLPKTESGKNHLESMNPDVTVIEHNVRLSSENALEILSNYDVIINGSDNFPTRYLVNDACVLSGKPLVDASILKWEGNVHVFMPGCGCYRCLFPEPPEPGTVPSCAEAGIIGALAGVIGSLQAMETIKVILKLDTIMKDRSFSMNVNSGKTRLIRRGQRADCPVCGDNPSIHRLIDYHQFCGLPSLQKKKRTPIKNLMLNEISINEALERSKEAGVVWLDVRNKSEYNSGHIPGGIHIELNELIKRIDELPGGQYVICVCEVGVISSTAVTMLRDAGFSKAFSLIGGLLEWENRGLPIEKH